MKTLHEESKKEENSITNSNKTEFHHMNQISFPYFITKFFKVNS